MADSPFRMEKDAVLKPELPRPHGSSVRIEAVACIVPFASRAVKLTTVRMPPNGRPSSVTLAKARTPTALGAPPSVGTSMRTTTSLVEASCGAPVPATM